MQKRAAGFCGDSAGFDVVAIVVGEVLSASQLPEPDIGQASNLEDGNLYVFLLNNPGNLVDALGLRTRRDRPPPHWPDWPPPPGRGGGDKGKTPCYTKKDIPKGVFDKLPEKMKKRLNKTCCKLFGMTCCLGVYSDGKSYFGGCTKCTF